MSVRGLFCIFVILAVSLSSAFAESAENQHSRPKQPRKDTNTDTDCDCAVVAAQTIPQIKNQQKALFSCLQTCIKLENTSPTPLKPLLYQQLGLLYDALGRNDLSVDAYEKATSGFAHDARLALSYLLLGNHYSNAQKFTLAEYHFKTAAQLRPDSSVPWNNLGNVYRGMERYQDAADAFQKSIEIHPLSMTYCNIAQMYEQMNEMEVADENSMMCSRLRLQEEGNWDEHQSIQAALVDIQLGFSYLEKNEFERASAAFSRAKKLSPFNADVELGFGNIFQRTHRYYDAIAAYKKGIRLSNGTKPEMWGNMGIALTLCGKYGEAVDSFRRALEQSPERADFHYGIAAAFLSMNREIKTAHDHLKNRKSTACSPSQKANPSPTRFADRSLELDNSNSDAFALYMYTAQSLCDWSTYGDVLKSVMEITQEQLSSGLRASITPFHSMMLPMSAHLTKQIAESHSKSTKKDADTMRQINSLTFEFSSKMSPSKTRIGYLSSDFRDHPLGSQIQGVFVHHNREKFEIYSFSTTPDDGSDIRRLIKENSHEFIDVSALNDVEIARLIYDKGIDILVNLNGWLSNNRHAIFALRPSPIQISAIGYPSTTGADFIDYLLTDKYTMRAEQDALDHTEKLLVLPFSYQITEHRFKFSPPYFPTEQERTQQRIEHGLPVDMFVFVSLNQVVKIEPTVFEAWMQILQLNLNSVLWLYTPDDETIQQNILSEAKISNIDESRILFFTRASKTDHLKRIAIADLALDTIVCNSHTTAADAIWAGLPLLTVQGERMSSRVAGSILQTIGMSELVAENLSDYIQKAVDVSTKKEVHKSLVERTQKAVLESVFFDTERWVRAYETGLQAVWERYLSGSAAENIVVAIP